mmetsp:Transcript_12099/g.32075  ORF Transcript_12099/g.32075 Transcript_12099/m.32075 type:complete len:88 (+) Transcript_12099:1819-2082(+)
MVSAGPFLTEVRWVICSSTIKMEFWECNNVQTSITNSSKFAEYAPKLTLSLVHANGGDVRATKSDKKERQFPVKLANLYQLVWLRQL